MSDLRGTAAVGIDTVEWAAESGGNLTVRITGRWRRRRPAATGQPTLVLEAEGRRHRFPALPEPPSLGGTGPGVWRLSFTIPGWLAPELGRTWIQFGTVIVPLPVAVPESSSSAPAAPAPSGTEAESAAAWPQEVLPPDSLTPQGLPGGTRAPAAPASAADGATNAPTAPEEVYGFLALEARVLELASCVDGLERELAEARAERDRLAQTAAEREREREQAEQRAQAERARREDLARQLVATEREAEQARQATADLAAAEERSRALEEDLRAAGHRADEAEQLAAAARLAGERAERARDVWEGRLARARDEAARAAAGEALRLEFESRLRARHSQNATRVAVEPAKAVLRRALAQPPPPAVPETEPPPPSALPTTAGDVTELVISLRHELTARARAQAGLRTRVIDVGSRLAARALLDERTTGVVRELRRELDAVGRGVVRERALRAEAERRAAALEHELEDQRASSRHAYEAIEGLKVALRRLARPARAVPASGRDVVVEPARLNDALSRLRDTIPPQDANPPPNGPNAAAPPAPALPAAAPGPTDAAPPPGRSLSEVLGRPSLAGPFRKLVRSDADAAGRLLLELLPLQHVVHPHPVSYDLVLAARDGIAHPVRRCVYVTVSEGTTSIALGGAPRPRTEADFQVRGDLAGLARLLTAGWLRRRFSRRVASVRGRRSGIAALVALLGTPLDLGDLHRAGVRLDPATAFALVASMIDPVWTRGERFTLGHEDPRAAATFLAVHDGAPAEVVRRPPDAQTQTTVVCPAGQLLAVLAGEARSELLVRGDQRPLSAVREWIKLAEGN